MKSISPFLKAFGHWFFCQSGLAKVIKSKILGILLPAIAGSYYLTLDVWGERWAILADYQELHGLIYCSLVTGSLLVLLWRAIADLFSDSRADEYTKILEKLLLVIGKIVKTKCDRFRVKLRDLKPSTNPFDIITQPEDQIRYILHEAQHFFAEMVGIAPEAVDGSVIRWDPYKLKWHSVVTTTSAGKPNTTPERLMSENSIAYKCLESGEELFVADKKDASTRGEYFISDKDKRYGEVGSAFCSPFWVVTDSDPDIDKEKQAYLVTFVTYGAKICESFDRDAEDSAKTLFREFVRRIEIECTLLSLKKWREYHHKQNKKIKAVTRNGGPSNEYDEEDAGEQQDNTEQGETLGAEDAVGTGRIIDTTHQVRSRNGKKTRSVRRA